MVEKCFSCKKTLEYTTDQYYFGSNCSCDNFRIRYFSDDQLDVLYFKFEENYSLSISYWLKEAWIRNLISHEILVKVKNFNLSVDLVHAWADKQIKLRNF